MSIRSRQHIFPFLRNLQLKQTQVVLFISQVSISFSCAPTETDNSGSTEVIWAKELAVVALVKWIGGVDNEDLESDLKEELLVDGEEGLTMVELVNDVEIRAVEEVVKLDETRAAEELMRADDSWAIVELLTVVETRAVELVKVDENSLRGISTAEVDNLGSCVEVPAE